MAEPLIQGQRFGNVSTERTGDAQKNCCGVSITLRVCG